MASPASAALRRPSKYRAVRTQVDGITFASKKEARRYGELRLMELGGLIRRLERQPVFILAVNGEEICRYIADFRYWVEDVCIVEDVKGMRRGAAYEMFKVKKRLAEAIYGIEVVEV